MKIIKRSGQEVEYNGAKIINAVTKASNSVPSEDQLTELQIRVIEEKVRMQLEKIDHSLMVEQIP